MLPLTAPKMIGALGFAIVAGCNAIAAQSNAPEAPIACSLTFETARGMVTAEATVEANEPISGEYELTVSRRGAELNQAGPFRLDAGETATLGQLTINGPASSLSADLTLRANGRSYSCPSV